MTKATSSLRVKSSVFLETIQLAITLATMTTVSVFVCLTGMVMTVLVIVNLVMMQLGTSCAVVKVRKSAVRTGMV